MLGALVTLPACGGGQDASSMQLDALRAEIVKLRAETAILTERLDAVEIAQGNFRGSKAASAPPSSGAAPRESANDRPDLTVVKLAPDAPAEPASDDANAEDAPRPVIRSVGGGAVIEDRATSRPKDDEPEPAARKKKKGWAPPSDAPKKSEPVRPKGPSSEGTGSSKGPSLEGTAGEKP